MASVVVSNAVGIKPDAFLDYCHSTTVAASCVWTSPRISFSLDFTDDDGERPRTSSVSNSKVSSLSLPDFEFRLEDPVSMLPADEIISDGKLVPLHLCRQIGDMEPEIRSEKTEAEEEGSGTLSAVVVEENGVISPKAPRCSTRWKELLCLKRAVMLNRKQEQLQNMKSRDSTSGKGLKYFLNRTSKSDPLADRSSLLPLLHDSDPQTISTVPSRQLTDKKRSYKPAQIGPKLGDAKTRKMPDLTVRTRTGQIRRAPETTAPICGVSIDSPKMSSSGKIIFQKLDRSSSSPSSFNGGARARARGMERSYSAGVRITPVLNVPVCSLRGSSKSMFRLFSLQKKESCINKSSSNGKNGTGSSSRSKNEKP